MLHIFRNQNVRNIVMGVVITVSVVVFAIQIGPGAGGGVSVGDLFKEQCAAKVGRECIDPKTQRAMYSLLMPRDEGGNADSAMARQMGLARTTLNGLVERELLIKEAERLGLRVDQDEVTDSIFEGNILVSVPSDDPSAAYYLRVRDGKLYAGFRDPKTKRFDQEVYERVVRNYTGRSPAEFREWQVRELLAARVREAVQSSVRVSEAEAKERYVAVKSSASLELVELAYEFFDRFLPAASQAELDAWAKDEAHTKRLGEEIARRTEAFVPKKDHIRHLLVRVSADAPEADKERAARTLLAAKARLARGELFATVAAAMSVDGSAANGGDVGDSVDAFVEPFKLAAAALKPGEVTAEPIETQFGWHLIAKDDDSKPLDVAKLRSDLWRALERHDRVERRAGELAKELLAAFKDGADEAKLNELLEVAFSKLQPFAGGSLNVQRLEQAAEGESKEPSWTRFTVAAPALLAKEDAERPTLRPTGSFHRGEDPIDGIQASDTLAMTEFAFSAKPGDSMPAPLVGKVAQFVVRLKEQNKASDEEFAKERVAFMEQLVAAKRFEALALYVKRLRDVHRAEIREYAENALNDRARDEDDES